MAQSGSPGEDAKEQIEKAARKASPWIDRLARMGYVAKGVVYVVIGSLALREALGFGGETTGPSSAFRSIGSQPFGSIMVALLAGGLACYALWKLVQGIMDPDEKGSDAHGILRRVGYVGSGVIHCCLAFIAAQSILGAEDSSEDAMTASAMAYQPPLGQLLVGVVGLVVIGVGLYQLYAGVTARYREDLKTYRMGDAGRWAMLAGRLGTTARAVVILVAGFFVILAAYHAEPSEARGLGDTLETLIHQPFGPYCIGAVSAGLVLYGVFMFVVARYRHIETT